MLERELQREVERMCRDRGLVWHHCRRTDLCSGQRGLPDLLIFGTAVIGRELKCGSLVMPWQYEFGDVMAAAGLSWGVWTPQDLASGRIGSELDSLVRR